MTGQPLCLCQGFGGNQKEMYSSFPEMVVLPLKVLFVAARFLTSKLSAFFPTLCFRLYILSLAICGG